MTDTIDTTATQLKQLETEESDNREEAHLDIYSPAYSESRQELKKMLNIDNSSSFEFESLLKYAITQVGEDRPKIKAFINKLRREVNIQPWEKVITQLHRYIRLKEQESSVKQALGALKR